MTVGQDHWSNQGHGIDCVWSKFSSFSVTWEKCKFSQGPLATPDEGEAWGGGFLWARAKLKACNIGSCQ